MAREKTIYEREVKPYKRKTAGKKTKEVKGYIQTYYIPRGKRHGVAIDNITSQSQTMWLKDAEGHFVGRANYEGKTTAKNIVRYGTDGTRVIRDAKRFKRVFGRTPSISRKR